MSKYVYFLLTRSDTLPSKMIYQLTKDEFTHISISTDDSLDTMFSFCRLYTQFPLPAGFAKESIRQGFYANHPAIPCELLKLKVNEKDFEKVEEKLEMMLSDSKNWKYDVLGMSLCRLGIEHERTNHRYCSWFVAELAGDLGLLNFEKHYSLVRPLDFKKFDELQRVYKGTVGDLAVKLNTLAA